MEDLTLRKGEFWSCSQCTLKNSLASHACSACKATRQSSSAHLSRQQQQPNNAAASPNVIAASKGDAPNATNMKNSASQASISGSGSSSNSSSNNKQHTSVVGSGSSHNNLMPPVNRGVSRSPSRNDRLSSGAIPKVSLDREL